MSEAPEAFTYDPGRSQNATFSETDLQKAALNVVSKTMSVFDAASTFNIPILKLWDKVLNFVKLEDNAGILTKQEERQIAQMVREATDIGCQPTMEDFIYTVKTTLAEKGQLCKLEKNKLGNEWILGFLNRHKGIALKPSESSQKQLGDCSLKKEIAKGYADESLSPEEALHKALEDVQHKGVNVFTAAKLYQVPPMTLWHEISSKDPAKPPRSRLGAAEEAEIADLLRDAIARGLEITQEDVRETVKGILDSKGRTAFNGNRPSHKWVPMFLMRNPGINLKYKPSRPSSGERKENTNQSSKNASKSNATTSCSLDSDHLSSYNQDGKSNPVSGGRSLKPSKISNKAHSYSSTEEGQPESSERKENIHQTAKNASKSIATSCSLDSDPSSSHNQDGKSSPVLDGKSLKTSKISNKAHSSCSTEKGQPESSVCVSSTPSMFLSFPSSMISSTSNHYGGVSSVSSACLATTTAYSSGCNTVPSSMVSNNHAVLRNELLAPPISVVTSSERERGSPGYHSVPASTMTGVAEESRKTTGAPDSVFSLLKRLTMINFSFGEERVLKFFSCMERREHLDDMDFDYWKKLIVRIVPPPPYTNSSWSSQAFSHSSQTQSYPRTNGYNSSRHLDSFPPPHMSHPGRYNDYHRYPHNYKSTYYNKAYHSQKTNERENLKVKVPNIQHKKGAKEERKIEEEEVEDDEGKRELKRKGKRKADNQDVETKCEKNRKKSKKEKDSESEEEDDTQEEFVRKEKKKSDKSSKEIKKKARDKASKEEKRDKEAQEDENLKKKDFEKKLKKKKKAKREAEEKSKEEENRKLKKKKKKMRKESENPVIRVEVDMKRKNTRVVFSDSSSDD